MDYLIYADNLKKRLFEEISKKSIKMMKDQNKNCKYFPKRKTKIPQQNGHKSTKQRHPSEDEKLKIHYCFSFSSK